MKTLLANHISDLGTPRKANFEIVIPDYDITLAVKNLNMPTMTTETVEANYANGVTYLAGKTKPDGTMTIALRQFLDADVVGTLVAWRNKVYNPKTGAIGRATEYKVKEAYIYQYDPKGNEMYKWVVLGLWPTKLDTGDGDYDSGDPCEVSLELSYDNTYRYDMDSVQPTIIKA